MITFAHLSDTHFDGGDRSSERAARVMAYLNRLPLDSVLVTGDIADHGMAAEYEQARTIMSSAHPMLISRATTTYAPRSERYCSASTRGMRRSTRCVGSVAPCSRCGCC